MNWTLLSYTSPRLDFGPAYRLQAGDIYGQGIWAPCLRYHNGTFYLFTNVNGRKTQVFTANDPAGPWIRREMKCSLHDLSVLFDDDGRIYAVWGYNEIKMAELEPDLSDLKPDTQRVIIPAGQGVGEGSHFYKIDGRYYILSANYAPVGRMVCARADRPEGPYESVVVSARETLGIGMGWGANELGRGETITLSPPRPNATGAIPLHQGGIVQTPSGEWWGITMMDHNAIGRLSCLSPVTWQDGWPYFGLPGNLTRTPRTWLKPDTGHPDAPTAVYARNDDFSAPSLAPIWQWNHVPDAPHWSLSDRPGALRLRPLPAPDLFHARNSLTQRAIGPESIATTQIDASGLAVGDIAGLGLLSRPHAWIGIARTAQGLSLRWHDELTATTTDQPITTPHVWLRVHADFDLDVAHFSFSVNGTEFDPIGTETAMAFQLRTFQGIRYALFAYNETEATGGHADFTSFQVDEPRAHRAIPIDQTLTFTSRADHTNLGAWNGLIAPVPASSPTAQFKVLDRGQGRVALAAADGSGFITVFGIGAAGDVRLTTTEHGEASQFQWQDMLRGDVMLISLTNHRYLHIAPGVGEPVSADSPGTQPDRQDGSCFVWSVVKP